MCSWSWTVLTAHCFNYLFDTVGNRLWCATGVGPRTDPFPSVRCRPVVPPPTSPALSTRVRGWYPDLRPLSARKYRRSVSEGVDLRWRLIVDESPMVLFRSTTAPDSNYGNLQLCLCGTGGDCRQQGVPWFPLLEFLQSWLPSCCCYHVLRTIWLTDLRHLVTWFTKPDQWLKSHHRCRWSLSWLIDRDHTFGQLVASFVYPEE